MEEHASASEASSERAPAFGTPVRMSAPPMSQLATPTPTFVRGAQPVQSLSADLVFSTPGAKGTPLGKDAAYHDQDCAICLEPLGNDSQEHVMHCRVRPRLWCSWPSPLWCWTGCT